MGNDRDYRNEEGAYGQGAFGQRDALMSPRGTHSRAADAVLELLPHPAKKKRE